MTGNTMAVPCFDEYSGTLTDAQVAAGMDAARDDAARLLADAELLFAAGRYPTAASIAILWIEETRKISILHRFAVCRSDKERGQIWNEYRTNTGKDRHVVDSSNRADRDGRDLQRRTNACGEQKGIIVALKHLGFHTECLGDGDWSLPEATVGKQLAEQFVAMARLAPMRADPASECA